MNPLAAPTKLKIVAYLFLFNGFSTLIGMVLVLLASRISFDFGVLGIFIGFGLLRLEERWRIWAVVFTWFGLIFAPIFIAIALASPSIPINVFGVQTGQVNKGWAILIGLIFFFYHVWQHGVLTYPDYRHRFRDVLR